MNPYPALRDAWSRWTGFDQAQSRADDVAEFAALAETLDALQAVRDYELLLLVGHGHKHEEIARALGVTRSAVTQQVAAARRRRKDR